MYLKANVDETYSTIYMKVWVMLTDDRCYSIIPNPSSYKKMTQY